MSNQYLVKIAAHYSVRPHSMDEAAYGMKSVSLNDAELNKYHEAKEKGMAPGRVLKHLGVGAAVGAGIGGAAAKLGGLGKYVAPAAGIGGYLGTLAGAKSVNDKSHDEAMTKVKANKFLSLIGKDHEKKANLGAILGSAGKIFSPAAGRTINATKNAAGVFTAKTPVRDAVTFIKANKKPLAIGAGIGGAAGLAAGSQVGDGQDKQAQYKEKEMTNKYLEKVASDHTVKGLVSPAWQEHAIAKEHGKKGPGVVESVVGDVAGRVRQSFNTGSGIVGGAAKGLTAGAILGGLGGAALMMKGHRGLPLSKAIKTQAAGEMAGMMGATGAVIGGVKGGYNGLMDTVKQHAKEVHHEYSTGAIDKHRKDVNNMAKEQYHKHMVEGYPTKSEINNMAKEQYHKHMVEGYPTKSEINNMALKQYALHNKQASEKWIQGAIKHPGALHKALGVPADEKIPEAKLEAAAKKGGKIGREARLAETLKNLRHGR